MMQVPAISRSTILRTTETLAIGAVGGSLFAWIGMPAGYLSGAMVAVAIFSIGGRELVVPHPLMNLMTALLGISLGSVVSPELLHGMSAYVPSLIVLAVSTIVVVAASTLYLHYVHGWDLLSALFGATPGALGQIMVQTLETRSDHVGVAIVQSLRVVSLALLTPLLLVAAGFSSDVAVSTRPVVDNAGILLLVAAALPLGYLFRLLNFPSPWIFGAMLGSGLLHGFDIVHGALPAPANNFALIVIGATVGSRFSSISRSAIVSYLAAGLGSMLVAFTITAAFGFAVYALLPLKPADVLVAFAPGALDAMMALSLALHLDPVYVGAHHMLRFIGIALLTPFAAKALAPKSAEAAIAVKDPEPVPDDIDPLDD